LLSTEGPKSVRLRRFPLHLPLQYRPAGGVEWFTGESENVSCSGVRFRGRVRMEPLTPVQVRIPLPQEIVGEGAAILLCGGYIVSAAADRQATEADMAAAFVEYRLQRQLGGEMAQLPPLDLAPTHYELSREFVHELRNLLAIIMGNSELGLAHGDLDPDLHQCLLRILEASERVAVLLRRMNGVKRARPA
jgi:signal transduction histidine kinase